MSRSKRKGPRMSRIEQKLRRQRLSEQVESLPWAFETRRPGWYKVEGREGVWQPACGLFVEQERIAAKSGLLVATFDVKRRRRVSMFPVPDDQVVEWAYNDYEAPF